MNNIKKQKKNKQKNKKKLNPEDILERFISTTKIPNKKHHKI